MKVTKKMAVSAALIGATLTGGALGATLIGAAGAQTDASGSSSAAAAAPDQAPSGPHAANGITEEVLTGDTADKVTAAAKAAVPGATIDRVETDAEGAKYEAHMTKSDGSRVTVKVNADFEVTSVENGMR